MNEHAVVPATWVESRLDAVRVVDVRDEWEYDGIGHVPGAVNVPFDRFRSEAHAAERDDEDGASEGMLPDPDVWNDLLSTAGVAPDDDLVAYDDEHGVFAARFLVTALLYGHPPEKLHLLDGDFSAWSREYETSRETPTVEETAYEASRMAASASPLVDYETVRDALDTDAVVVDTREPWEFEEGHLPGAVQLDWRELVDEASRGLKPRDELESILRRRGITPDRRIVLYCNTARRISHTFIVLRYLDYDDVEFYEGSLTEWKERGGPLESAE
ncbi:sulfurtransferase [Salinirarus marinus]|uniref:sulfurtransferase n=1 Tax=Salinirarus marinus TaxID=3068310 RepID=UPI003C6C3A95